MGLGALGSMTSGNAMAAEDIAIQGGLGAASAVDPTGASDAAAEIYRRSKMNPEQIAEVRKQDYRDNLQDRLPGISEFEMETLGYEDGGMPKKLDTNDLNILRQLKDAKSEVNESNPEEYTEKLAIRRALLQKMMNGGR